jgi:PAS domain S-box-containing protein
MLKDDENNNFNNFIETTFRNCDKKYLDFINSLPVGILVADIGFNIMFANSTIFSLFNYSNTEFLSGFNLLQIISESDRNAANIFFKDIISTKDNKNREFIAVRKDGSEFPITISSISIFENGKLVGLRATLIDISKYKLIEQELIIMKDKAEEMNRIKTSFFANMSHELRTPMVAILGFSELLIEIADNPEIKDFADNIIKSAKRLLETLNLILDLSRIEAGRLEIVTREVDIVQLSKNIFQEYISIADKKRLKIIFCSSRKQIFCKVDERILWESINNLLNNAIKYTNVGEIRIDISINKTNALIKVSDTGIGIPKDKMDLIFEEFRQVSEGLDRSFEGAGLGLSITKNFISKLGGKIFIEQSIVGKGTTFTISLPVLNTKVKESRIIKHKEGKMMKKLNSKSKNRELIEILCIDDNQLVVNIIKAFLKDLYNIDHAESGENGIEKARHKKYSIILMDINLGKGIDGLQTTKILRTIRGYKKTPIVAITAYAMIGDRKKFLDGGCSHYISKPFRRDDLRTLISDILLNKQK